MYSTALQGGSGAAWPRRPACCIQWKSMRAHERPADERAQAELEAILARRPDLKARALEAVKRIIRRERRLSHDHRVRSTHHTRPSRRAGLS